MRSQQAPLAPSRLDAGQSPSSSSSITSVNTNRYPWRDTVRMKRGSRESSPSVRRIVRISWLSGAVGHDDVAPHAVEDLAAVDRLGAMFDQENEEVEVGGMSGCSRPSRPIPTIGAVAWPRRRCRLRG